MDWSPMKPSGQAKLAPWPGMAPQFVDSGSADDFIPKPSRSFVWPLIGLISVLLIAAVMALVVRNQNLTDTVSRMSSGQSETINRAGVDLDSPTIKPAIVTEPTPPARPESLLTPKQTEEKIKALAETLFTASTNEERVACIADAKHQRQSLEDYFSKLSEPHELKTVRALTNTVRCLPLGQPAIVCLVETRQSTHGPAITRLISEEDGAFKLDWPMLSDSLQATLSNYSKTPHTEPQWTTIGIRRNFGFDEKESVRQTQHVFDIQGLGNGSDRTFALAAKDSPIGRMLDKTIAWNELFIVRVLLHYVNVDDQPRLSIIDTEAMPLNDSP